MNKQHPTARANEAEQFVKKWLAKNGWGFDPVSSGPDRADLIAQNQGERFTVEVKALSEGRPDRVIPLLSQAILQAQSYAASEDQAKPMAVVYVERASSSLYKSVLDFAERYAPDVAVGVVSGEGLGLLKRGGADFLVIDDRDELLPQSRARLARTKAPQSFNLFSDLNQWMLKILLAPEIPEDLLNATRGRYRSGAELAAAAKVSEMSASRFLQQLRQERFLDESAGFMVLVRREELFDHWRSAARRRPPEAPMRFLLRSAVQEQIAKLVKAQHGEACVGLFAAADALGLGHVSGVPPYVYVPRLPNIGNKDGGWDMVIAFPDGAPDFIVRQAPSPQSTFRGAIHRDGSVFADVLQIWLDVSNHPTRGQEQADLIHRKILQPLIEARH
jgi:Holliday junction resolvase-like predicted endonuclease